MTCQGCGACLEGMRSAAPPVSTAMHCRDCQFQMRMVWSSEADTILKPG